MKEYVLDASAVLGLLNQEPGMDRVEAALSNGVIATVNYSEVLGKLIDAGLSVHLAEESVSLLGIEIVNFDQELARLTATLLPSTKKLGLSLGDRCCIALGLMRRSPVLTAERIWAKLDVGLRIELIR